MSGGNLRSHERCKKSKKFDYDSPICKVCGYTVFFKEDGQERLDWDDIIKKVENGEEVMILDDGKVKGMGDIIPIVKE